MPKDILLQDITSFVYYEHYDDAEKLAYAFQVPADLLRRKRRSPTDPVHTFLEVTARRNVGPRVAHLRDLIAPFVE